MEDIILVGFGGHAKSIADSIEQSKEYRIIGYTEQTVCNGASGYNYLGTDDVLEEYYSKGVKCAMICVGYLGKSRIRDRLYTQLKSIGYKLPVIIDNSAIIAKDARIEEGSYIGKGAIVNANAKLDKMCIINSGAIVEHECKIGEFVHVAVGAVLCGNVSVRAHSFVGANATIIQGISIGENCVIGAGSTVLKNVVTDKTVYGVY